VSKAAEDMPLAARIPTQEWEARKESIRNLYLEQGKTLEEMINSMEEQGFSAT
jgi:hypothetical protein